MEAYGVKPLYNVADGLILAKKYEERYMKDIDTDGVWVSEKLDGIRACWNGVNLRSRVDKPIHAPKWFTDALPKDIPLDGELFLGKEMFNETSSIVRKKVPVDSEWRKIKYCVFDVPTDKNTPYEKRLSVPFLNSNQVSDGSEPATPEWVEQVHKERVFSIERMMELYKEYLDKGAEGIMIRLPKSKYNTKRTSDLLKMKPFSDFEVIVYDYEDGNGKYKNMLGALMVHLVDNKNVTFKVGTGLKDIDRMEYETRIPIGSKITVSYQSINEKTGVPRFPAFVGVRSID